jgi:hypothetical protein
MCHPPFERFAYPLIVGLALADALALPVWRRRPALAHCRCRKGKVADSARYSPPPGAVGEHATASQ